MEGESGTESEGGGRDSIGELDARLFDFDGEGGEESEPGGEEAPAQVGADEDAVTGKVEGGRAGRREEEGGERRAEVRGPGETGGERTERAGAEEESSEGEKNEAATEARMTREEELRERREAGKGKSPGEGVGGITWGEQDGADRREEEEEEDDEEFDRIISGILLMTQAEEQKDIAARERGKVKRPEGHGGREDIEKEGPGEAVEERGQQEGPGEAVEERGQQEGPGEAVEGVSAVEGEQPETPDTAERGEKKAGRQPDERVGERGALDERRERAEEGQRFGHRDREEKGAEGPEADTRAEEATSPAAAAAESRGETPVLAIADMGEDEEASMERWAEVKGEDREEREGEVVEEFDRVISSMLMLTPGEEPTVEMAAHTGKERSGEREGDGERESSGTELTELEEDERVFVREEEEEEGREEGAYATERETADRSAGQPGVSYGETGCAAGEAGGGSDATPGKAADKKENHHSQEEGVEETVEVNQQAVTAGKVQWLDLTFEERGEGEAPSAERGEEANVGVDEEPKEELAVSKELLGEEESLSGTLGPAEGQETTEEDLETDVLRDSAPYVQRGML